MVSVAVAVDGGDDEGGDVEGAAGREPVARVSFWRLVVRASSGLRDGDGMSLCILLDIFHGVSRPVVAVVVVSNGDKDKVLYVCYVQRREFQTRIPPKTSYACRGTALSHDMIPKPTKQRPHKGRRTRDDEGTDGEA